MTSGSTTRSIVPTSDKAATESTSGQHVLDPSAIPLNQIVQGKRRRSSLCRQTSSKQLPRLRSRSLRSASNSGWHTIQAITDLEQQFADSICERKRFASGAKNNKYSAIAQAYVYHYDEAPSKHAPGKIAD